MLLSSVSSMRENILRKISTGRREIGDSSFLRDFMARALSSRSGILRVTSRARALSSRRDMLWSRILRVTSKSKGLGKYKAFELSGKRITG